MPVGRVVSTVLAIQREMAAISGQETANVKV